jgi:hypothetical protein
MRALPRPRCPGIEQCERMTLVTYTSSLWGQLIAPIPASAAERRSLQVQLEGLRIFIDAEASLHATTRDVLFMHARAAWLEIDGLCLALNALLLAPTPN